MPTPSPLAAAPRRFAGGLSYGRRFVVAASLALVASCLATKPVRAVDLDWVTVGNPGNVKDVSNPLGLWNVGAVNYEYRISKYEVTIGQYVEFLNANPRLGLGNEYFVNFAFGSDSELYNPQMGTRDAVKGIARSGSNGSYTYSAIGNPDRPVTYVSYTDAARYANWLHNGKQSNNVERGAYTFDLSSETNSPGRNPGALYWIPTRDEWYKAAFYSPALNSGSGGYYQYATQSNTAPGNVIGSGSNQANYALTWTNQKFSVTQASEINQPGQNYLTTVGAFSGSPSFYGTYDQSGGVREWVDQHSSFPGRSSVRLQMGGSWMDYDSGLQKDKWTTTDNYYNVWEEGPYTGFRLASVVPRVAGSGTQSYASAVSGIVTTSSSSSVRFNGGFSGLLDVASGMATLGGGTVTGAVQIASGAAVNVAYGLTFQDAWVSLTPGGLLSIDRGAIVPVAAGNIGGISISSTAGRVATVLSGSLATATNISAIFSPIGNFTAAGSNKIVGDVLSFQGTGSATWALQMQYDPLALGGNEATLAAAGDLFLSWRKPATNTWVNSVDGNTGGTKQFFQRGWLSGDTLGSYGVDVNTHTVWAVVNHNSDFAVTAITPVTVPEPSTWAMAAAGIACAAGGAWRRKARRRSP